MSSLGAQPGRLQIIGTTYRSMIFKTRVFSLYSHLCIYIGTHLHTVYIWTGCRRRFRGFRGAPENDDRDRDRASLAMHLEALLVRTWRP